MAKGWNTNAVELQLGRVRAGERAAAARGLAKGTEHILQVANTMVPIEEATLERSGRASVEEGTLTGAVFYDTPYAVRQHEDMSYQHDSGRRAKYLEAAFNSERSAVAKIIADEIIGGMQ